MINKGVLVKYVRIISGCDANPNLTLVDFSLNEEQRNIVNLVNNEAKKDKKLANLLDDLKYSNNKNMVIEKYFAEDEKAKLNNNSEDNESVKHAMFNARIGNRGVVNNYGFINLSSLGAIVSIVAFILSVVVTFCTK